MKFLMTYRPAQAVDGIPKTSPVGESMADYSARMMKAGILLEQGMFEPSRARVILDDGNFSVSNDNGGVQGYAFVQAESFDAAIQRTKEFLAVAGAGMTDIRQVVG